MDKIQFVWWTLKIVPCRLGLHRWDGAWAEFDNGPFTCTRCGRQT